MVNNDPEYGRDIGWAISMMHRGAKVRRTGWNGKGMWLKIVQGSTDLRPQRAGIDDYLNALQWFVVMWTAQKTAVPWLCSQSDLLASDWELAEE
jgi:hypothetical protein